MVKLQKTPKKVYIKHKSENENYRTYLDVKDQPQSQRL
jgi:hypothetical protein